ncbi:MAG: hypothetical protein OEY59_06360, partial [Deltaproteobacteria bacterium]|nr:hypothetical protein [Deltaproteobacteria bacterium]
MKERLRQIYANKELPDCGEYLSLLNKTNDRLNAEDKALRPHSRSGKPGGLINLKRDLSTIIIPDLHARMDFFLSCLSVKDEKGVSVLEGLALGETQVVCVGDGFHAENRAVKRWELA